MPTKANWARRFAVQHIVLLTSSKGSVELVKKKKQEFVAQHNLKSAEVFSNRDSARELLSFLIETRRIASETDLRRVAVSSPFLEKCLNSNDIEEAKLALGEVRSEVISPEDLSKLSQAEYIAEKTQELTEEASRRAEVHIAKERERLKELAVQLEQKIRLAEKAASELDRLPEAIDPEKYVADRPEEVEVVPGGRSLLWWERLGLSADPFPTKLGLNRIPKEKYDEVVVQTEVFRNYLDTLERRPRDLFGKTILITGEFGSGKTTFFQYMSYKAAAHRILPIQVILDPMADADLIRESLYSAVFAEISDALRRRGLVDPRVSGVKLDLPVLMSALKELAETSQVTGFLLSIDGLHKAESNLSSSLEFVKQLQGFHENLDGHDIDAVILIAGSPLWLRTITQNPSYSGSFYRIDEIPDLSPEGAFKLLQNRLKAFESPSGIPVFLDRTGIEFAYREVATKNGGRVTFRSFINYVLPRLERGEYDKAGISVAIDREAFEKIHKKLQQSSIRESYELYRRSTARKSKLLRSCGAVLESLYKQGYIPERAELFQQNQGAFWTLSKCHLIQKVRATGEAFGWGFAKDFLAVLENLNEQGMPPEVVFRCMSMDPERLPPVQDPRGDPTLVAAQDFVARWGAEWPEVAALVTVFIERHEESLSALFAEDSVELCGCCQSAIRQLVTAGQSILRSTLPPEEWVETTWVDLSTPETILSVLATSSVDSRQKYDFVTRYNEAALALLDSLDDLLRAFRVVDLASAKLEKRDRQGLMSAAVSLEAGDLVRAVDDVNTRLEQKIRTTFHLALALHYGPDYELQIPGTVRKRLDDLKKKTPTPLRRSADSNLLYHFSRGEYAELLKPQGLWATMFQDAFAPHLKEEVIAAVQRSFSLDTRRAHRDRPVYFREVREEIRKAIVDGRWLLEGMDNLVEKALFPPGILRTVSGSEIFMQVSFRGQGYVSTSFRWRLLESLFREVYGRIARRPAPFDMSQDSLVSATLGCSVTEACLVVADLAGRKEVIVEFVDGRTLVRISPRSTAEN